MLCGGRIRFHNSSSELLHTHYSAPRSLMMKRRRRQRRSVGTRPPNEISDWSDFGGTRSPPLPLLWLDLVTRAGTGCSGKSLSSVASPAQLAMMAHGALGYL